MQKVEISISTVYDGAPESQKKLQWYRHKFRTTLIFLRMTFPANKNLKTNSRSYLFFQICAIVKGKVNMYINVNYIFLQQQKAEQARKKSIAGPLKKVKKARPPSMWVLLWYYPVARRNFFLITFNWLANALVYNGLSFYSADLGKK